MPDVDLRVCWQRHVEPKNASMHVSHVVSRRGEKEYHSYLVRRRYRDWQCGVAVADQ